MTVESIKIVAQNRSLSTKGALREMRQQGLVPATVFGKSGSKTIAISVKNLPKQHPRSTLVNLDIDGKTTTVLMRDVQVDPLKDTPVHMDFQEVSPTEVVKVKVPLNFVGLTREQEKEGSFKVLLRSLLVKGPANKLPSSLTVDVSRLKVDESAHIGDVSLPEGVNLAAARNLALASLVRF
ncbi:MAG: 50S ribosomal protein L25 [Betaproteobacteria bacterium]|nr:50S ribosomal protein L25 [Betaproteobacteria bacterium]